MRFQKVKPLADFHQFDTQTLHHLLNQMKKIADKQGVVVVMQDDSCLTAYNLNSYRRSNP